MHITRFNICLQSSFFFWGKSHRDGNTQILDIPLDEFWQIHAPVKCNLLADVERYPTKFSCAHSQWIPSPGSSGSNCFLTFFPHSLVLTVLELHINGNILQYTIYYFIRLFSPSMCLRFIHVLSVSVVHYFLFLSNISLCAPPLMVTWAVPIILLSWWKLLWHFYKSHFGNMYFYFSWVISQEWNCSVMEWVYA